MSPSADSGVFKNVMMLREEGTMYDVENLVLKGEDKEERFGLFSSVYFCRSN